MTSPNYAYSDGMQSKGVQEPPIRRLLTLLQQEGERNQKLLAELSERLGQVRKPILKAEKELVVPQQASSSVGGMLHDQWMVSKSITAQLEDILASLEI